jgi:DNA-binding MarR family transcriptional regulator
MVCQPCSASSYYHGDVTNSDPAASDALTSSEIRKEEVDVTFLIWLTARATSALMDSALAPTGLSGDEFAVYSILASSEVTTPTALARWMAAPPTTVSSYVKRLEGRGHVDRVPNPEDKRSYRIVLTPAGRVAQQAAVKAFSPVSAALSEALGEQEGAISDALLSLRPILDTFRTPDRT